MVSINYKDVIIEIVQGDITKQPDIEAIVNAANAYLKRGGGVAGAIHKAAGPELEKECEKYAPIKPGEAVITKGYKLPNKYVIHCLGPVYGKDKPEDKILSLCYQNALKICEEKDISSIAFPAISTGFFGYPIEEAAEIALKTCLQMIPKLKKVKKIRFVLFDKEAYNIYENKLKELLPI
uniref:Macro domain-containing protein n=1 Tax=candidate division WOR-3 bacterium TaxID=2052148 RepID=A0A7V4FDZ3_UNCW3